MDAYPSVKTAFVSTNSISQGEQVGILWKNLFETHKIKILFAHQTFKWSNEAKGVAAVHCVIVGFAPNDAGFKKAIFEYADIKEEPTKIDAKNINPYLVEGKDLWIEGRRVPLCDVPPIIFGSMPNDGGHLILSDEEIDDFIRKEPKSRAFIRLFLGAHEFINGKKRWCLWLKDALPNEIKALPEVIKRVNAVKRHRESSNRGATNKLAATPMLFGEDRQPYKDYILMPSTSSERRSYIPTGFVSKEVVASNACLVIPSSSTFHFAILTSKMHMAWVKYVCGRLKSDYRYSNEIVYNNYPFPENVTAAQKQKVETAAQAVLSIREHYSATGSSLADMYDPDKMPSDLKAAHDVLDKSVDDCYEKTRFTSESKRIGFLFDLYAEYIEKEKGWGVKKGKKGTPQ